MTALSVGHDVPLPLAERWTLNREEVCQLMGISTRTFAHRQRALMRAGFPPRLPGLNRYSAAAVRAWIEQQLVNE